MQNRDGVAARAEAQMTRGAVMRRKDRPMPSASTQQRFSPLEARVIRLAASPAERRRSGRGARIVARLAGCRTSPTLADARLEALRAQAVRLRDGTGEIDPAFIAAGYTAEDADTIRGVITAVARRTSPAARRDRAARVGGIGLALGSFAGFIGIAVTCLI